MFRRQWGTALVGVVCLMTCGVIAQDAIPAALAAMADTEREFARTAQVKGIRDSFLEFFAPDAIALTPDPVSARERLLAQEPTPFSVDELLWEPRTGDVAASGDIGWLTGPSTFINHSGADQTPRYGNYLSVWRKQPDGRWRVFIDVGTGLPAAATFAPGFTRTPLASRYSGKDDKATASASLLDADRRLNAAMATRRRVAGVRRRRRARHTAAPARWSAVRRAASDRELARGERRRPLGGIDDGGERGVR